MKRSHLFTAIAGGGVAVAVMFASYPAVFGNPTAPASASETGSAEGSGHKHEEGAHTGEEEAGKRPEGAASKGSGHNHEEGAHTGEEEAAKLPEGAVKMSAAQLAASKIDVMTVGPGTLSKRLTVPGVIIPDRNRVGRVAAKVIGTVAELKKRLGETVEKGELIAILDSREVADAKSEFFGARVNQELQSTLFEREETLWKKQVTAEQRLLRARTTNREAELRSELARQKLSALGISDEEIEALKTAGDTAKGLERYQVRSPIGGRVVEQLVDLGTPVGGEGQAKELYAVADLSALWVELTVPTADLDQVREGQRVTISNGSGGKPTTGKIVFTSPLLNQDTRSAKVIAEIDNATGAWRPGAFVTADIAIEERAVAQVIPNTAVQTIEGKPNVFVRTEQGFQARALTTANDDGQLSEVTSGLEPGEVVAVTNTFLLKAEIGKSEAEHAH